ncbi:unnamed protein product [Aphis gossypii]|uniref:Uncharacterized protein n=1 Tax=Aphis gossypii TaxID=80765 RepID=A0A9P0JBD5_APHGO|nr:unnamed protein product [Aphis gossypii]
MFLLYTTVPAVFAFALLLNFFFMYSPVNSDKSNADCPKNEFYFKSCNECMISPCYTDLKRPCYIVDGGDTGVMCYNCAGVDDGDEMFNELEKCRKSCNQHKSKYCTCIGGCYWCIEAAGKYTTYHCDMPYDKPVCEEKKEK